MYDCIIEISDDKKSAIVTIDGNIFRFENNINRILFKKIQHTQNIQKKIIIEYITEITHPEIKYTVGLFHGHREEIQTLHNKINTMTFDSVHNIEFKKLI